MNTSKLSPGWSALAVPTPSPLDSDRLYFMVDTTATDMEFRYPNFVDMVIAGLTGMIPEEVKGAAWQHLFVAMVDAAACDPTRSVRRAVWGEIVAVATSMNTGAAAKVVDFPERRYGWAEPTEHPAVKGGSSYYRVRDPRYPIPEALVPLTFRVPLLREFTPAELVCIKANAHRVAKLYGFEVRGFRYVLEQVSRLQVKV